VRLNSGGARVKTAGAQHRASRPELRALAFAALALALLGIAGLASSASAWHSTPVAAAAPTTALRGLAVAGGVVLVVALLLIWVEIPRAPPPKRHRRRPAGDELDELGGSLWTASKTTAVVLLALAVFCIAALPLLARPSVHSEDRMGAPPSASAGPPRSEGPKADLGWLLLPIVATFAILTPAAVLIRRRLHSHRQEAADAEEPGALGRAVRASIAALESERDPRTAILRAYARMEQSFRRVEVVRARDETASEFLGRTMRQLPVSAGAATELTERFEEARFSTHRLTEADREQALASLHRVERELAERP
jgi:TRAP-type C4-dicarboxylate transport system permease small subunit